MRTICKDVFKYEELNDKAKEKARDWFREGNLDYAWWEFVYEEATTIGEILGIDLRTRAKRLKDGTLKYDPQISFSGFYTQGSYASFEGRYQFAKNAPKKIREHAPKDTELHRIADALQEIQEETAFGLSASIKSSNHGGMSIEVFTVDDNYADEDQETAVKELLRDFADWIYKQLQNEYEFQNAEEQVEESIISNEYEFDIDGKRA